MDGLRSTHLLSEHCAFILSFISFIITAIIIYQFLICVRCWYIVLYGTIILKHKLRNLKEIIGMTLSHYCRLVPLICCEMIAYKCMKWHSYTPIKIEKYRPLWFLFTIRNFAVLVILQSLSDFDYCFTYGNCIRKRLLRACFRKGGKQISLIMSITHC